MFAFRNKNRGGQRAIKTILFVCLVLLSASFVAAEPVPVEDSVVATADTIALPPDGFVDGWSKAEPMLRFTRNDLYGYINGGAELFLEFGFRELLVQKYAEGDRNVALEIYRMESAAAALGVYLTRRGDETPVPGITTRNSGSLYQFNVLQGNCFFQVNNFDGDSSRFPIMVALAQQTTAAIPESTPVELLDHLPPENLVAGSELLIRGPYALQPIFTFGEGDIFQLGGKVYGVVGKYQDDRDSLFTRIIIPYPDEKAALSAYRNLRANLDPYLKIINQREDGFDFKDYRNKFGVVQLEGKVLRIKVNLENL